METIYAKINELLQVSKEDLIGDKDFGKKFDAKMKRQNELMDELEVLAKAKKTLLGRTIQFPMADSYALYLITGVNAKTVQLKWLNWCDAWVDDRCGYACRLDRKYAEQSVYGRDRLNEMFSNAKKGVQA
jgi:hypothetical protein